MSAYSLEYLENEFKKIYILRNNCFDNQEKTQELVDNINNFSIIAESFMETLEFQKYFNTLKRIMNMNLTDLHKGLIIRFIEITMMKIKKICILTNNIKPVAFTTKSPLVYRRNEQKI